MKCIGTALHLKNLYGQGYSLHINYIKAREDQALGLDILFKYFPFIFVCIYIHWSSGRFTALTIRRQRFINFSTNCSVTKISICGELMSFAYDSVVHF